jgi:hypothetical protein
MFNQYYWLFIYYNIMLSGVIITKLVYKKVFITGVFTVFSSGGGETMRDDVG